MTLGKDFFKDSKTLNFKNKKKINSASSKLSISGLQNILYKENEKVSHRLGKMFAV